MNKEQAIIKGFKLLLGIKNVPKCLAFTLALIFLYHNRILIDEWIAKYLLEFLRNFYFLIEENTAVNCILLALVGCLIYNAASVSFRSKYNSYFVISSVYFLSCWIYTDIFWGYPSIPFVGIKYRLVIAVSLWLCLILMEINNITCCYRYFSEKSGRKGGFEVVTKQADMIHLNWTKYAKAIVERLKATDLSSEGIACAIVSKWGTGKTTFLEELRSVLTEDTIAGRKTFGIMEFNPWKSGIGTGEEAILNHFCSVLTYSLGNDRNFGRTLKHYIKLLDNFGLKDWSSWIEDTICSEDISLSDARERVEDFFVFNGKTVVMIIDDMDRLTSSELMAILKLIRVTANFKNLIYIAAYDEDYVEGMLRRSGIENGKEYLKKIFHVKICLPSFEPLRVPELLRNNLSRLGVDDEKLNIVDRFIKIREKESFLISIYLPTFRDIKIFSNQFALAYSQISDDLRDQIDWHELFVIELLLYHNSSVYEELRRIPARFLEEGQDAVWRLKKDINAVIGPDTQNSKTTFFLLSHLFKDEGNLQVSGNSIRRPEAFLRYFAFRYPVKKIKEAEFEAFCAATHSTEEINNKYLEWTDFADPYTTESLYRVIITATQHGKFDGSPEPAVRHVNSIIFLIVMVRYFNFRNYIEKIKDMMSTNDIPGRTAESLKGLLYQNLASAVAFFPEKKLWLPILKTLTSTDTYLEDEPEAPREVSFKGILSNEQLSDLACQLFNCIFADKEEDVRNITQASPLNEFLVNSVFESSRMVYFGAGEDGEVETWKMLLPAKALTAYFSSRPQKPGYDIFKEFIRPIEVLDEYESEIESLQPELNIPLERIERIFGNAAFYKNFIKESFDLSEDQVNAHLKNVHIA